MEFVRTVESESGADGEESLPATEYAARPKKRNEYGSREPITESTIAAASYARSIQPGTDEPSTDEPAADEPDTIQSSTTV